MDHAGQSVCVGRHAALAQALRIGFAFITQGVVFADQHRGGGQARHRLHAQRRRIGRRAIRFVQQVGKPAVPHGLFGHEKITAVVLVGLRGERIVHHGIEQQLVGDCRPHPVARHDRCGGRQVAARAVSANSDALPVDAQHVGVEADPLQAGVHVFDRHGNLVLERQPVIHRVHLAAGGVGQGTTRVVVQIKRTPEPPATVREHDGGHGLPFPASGWRIGPDPQRLPVVAHRLKVGDGIHRFRLALQRAQPDFGRGADLLQHHRRGQAG